MYWGADYFTFLTEELPEIVHYMFPRISKKREDNYIAGFSLGGSGAVNSVSWKLLSTQSSARK